MLFEIFQNIHSGPAIALRGIIVFGLSTVIALFFLMLIDKYLRPKVRNWRQKKPAKARTVRRYLLRSIQVYWIVFFLLFFLFFALKLLEIESDWIAYFSIPMVILSGVLLLTFIGMGGMRFLNFHDFQHKKKIAKRKFK